MDKAAVQAATMSARARRRDGLGGRLTAPDVDGLYKIIADDHSFRPMRREDVP